MLTRRRLLWALPIVLLVSILGYTAWSLWQTRNDLADAEASAGRLRTAVTERDGAAVDAAVADLQVAASSAAKRTGGPWWGLLTQAPWVGDDVEGIRALSGSLDVAARDGVAPLTDTLDGLQSVTAGGGLDLEVVRGLSDPVAQAHRAFAAAEAEVTDLDSSGYADPIRARFEDYVDLVTETTAALASGQVAVDLLPAMAGGEGTRHYLMVFQNNAEIRATGGLPGLWALVRADAGRFSILRQGTPVEFGVRAQPLRLTPAEQAVYSEAMGAYFQSANFTPDFPRAAELMATRWEEEVPGTQLDGVLALDPVGLSYLLEGTGPVSAGGRTLTSDNAVEELLSRPYLELEPAAQDVLFQEAAQAIFSATTGELADPVAFVGGLRRAAAEGRFLVAPARQAERELLAGTQVLGALPEDDGETPHVEISLNDATGSKMSYYLRYAADVEATDCRGGVQTLRGSMTLSQSIAPEEAAQLPTSVTGGGNLGTEPGMQLVAVRIHGPHAGAIGEVRMDGRKMQHEEAELDGRPVATVLAFLSSKEELLVEWDMESGAGQTGDGMLGITPGLASGGQSSAFAAAC